MRRKYPSLKQGRIIFIPVGNKGFCAAQILVEGVVFYLGASLELIKDYSDFCYENCAFGLFSWTTDAEVRCGNWISSEIICEVNGDYPRPEYLLQSNGNFIIESFDGERTRKFNPEQDGNIGYRISRSPVIIQDALEAYHGFGEWTERFPKMLPK
jgi:hypothetical protein